MPPKAIKIFLLNAPEDHSYLVGLRAQLDILERKGILDNWDNTEIKGGMVISDVIEENLKEAEIFIPLVSADYLASDKCQIIQKKAVELGKKILPVIVRDCLWDWDDDLTKHPVYPQKENGEVSPLSHWNQKGTAYRSIAEGIQKMLKSTSGRDRKNKENSAYGSRIMINNNQFNKEIARLEKRIQSKQKSIDRYHDMIDQLDDSISNMNVMTDILDINKLERQKELVEEQLEKYEEEVKELEVKLTQLKSGHKNNDYVPKSEEGRKETSISPSKPIKPTTIVEIRMAIRDGELKEAMEAMLEISERKDKTLHTEVFMQLSRYNTITRNSTRYNTVSPERADTTYAQIRYTLLEILEDMENL